ncbi:MAG: hypothetical protein E7366_03105 [Clostridiales bacterium]|nr:hypothetical protein [Clostridiales bacterium]
MRKNAACFNCGYYRAFYTKEICRFEKQDHGLCRKSGEYKDKHEVCPHWKAHYVRIETQKRISMRKLNNILTQIIEIRQILFDAQEEMAQDALEEETSQAAEK